jgi:MSHA pilin protein MshD
VSRRTARPLSRRQSGVGLIEVIISMVLLGVVVGGILSAWSFYASRSADPLVARQALAVATSLLREIELQPLPGQASTGGGGTGRAAFTSIADYNGLVMDGITDAEGVALPGLGAYRAQVSVTQAALQGVPASQGWWIQVRITPPAGSDTVLALWRSVR